MAIRPIERNRFAALSSLPAVLAVLAVLALRASLLASVPVVLAIVVGGLSRWVRFCGPNNGAYAGWRRPTAEKVRKALRTHHTGAYGSGRHPPYCSESKQEALSLCQGAVTRLI